MKKSTVILIHALFWFFYLAIVSFIIYVITFVEGNIREEFNVFFPKLIYTSCSFIILPSILNFYSGYIFSFKGKRKASFYKVLLVLFVLTPVIVNLLISLYFDNFLATQAIRTLVEQFIVYTVIGLFLLIAGIICKGFISWFEENKKKNELLQANQEMELELIKAQLDPHFLFNTLNNIDVLIQKNPEKASLYLTKLSDLMRFMLYETKTESIPLAQEVGFIEKYLDLQKIRSSNENFIQFTTSGELDKYFIPPLLLIPFIENAVKHSLDKSLNQAIQIEINANEQEIQFICINKFKTSSSILAPEGIGNSLIKNRLKLTYPDRHQLLVKTKNETYEVTLILQHEKV